MKIFLLLLSLFLISSCQNEKSIEEKKEVVSLKTDELKWEVWKKVEDKNAKDWDALMATVKEDKNWWIVTWNEIILNKWTYKVTYRIKLSDISKKDVAFNIFMLWLNNLQENYSKEFYWKDFKEKDLYSDFKLRFNIEKDWTKVMPWVYFTWQADMFIDDIKIEKSDVELDYTLKANWTKIYEESDLWNKVWKIIKDETAINKKVLVAKQWIDKEDHVAFWPYSTSEKEWIHKASFRLKISDNSIVDKVARIEVFNSGWDWTNKSLEIRWIDFDKKDEFQNFDLFYKRTTLWTMEYRVYYYWKWDLYFDNITNNWIY